MRRTYGAGLQTVEHQYNCHTSTGTDSRCHDAGDDRSRSRTTHEAPPHIGITHSINPGVPCAETVVVVVMSTGSHLLVGYPQGEPAALVFRDDAGPLWQALEAAFGHTTDEAADNGTANASSSSNNTTRRTKPVPEGMRLLSMRSDIPRWLEGIPR